MVAANAPPFPAPTIWVIPAGQPGGPSAQQVASQAAPGARTGDPLGRLNYGEQVSAAEILSVPRERLNWYAYQSGYGAGAEYVRSILEATPSAVTANLSSTRFDGQAAEGPPPASSSMSYYGGSGDVPLAGAGPAGVVASDSGGFQLSPILLLVVAAVAFFALRRRAP